MATDAAKRREADTVADKVAADTGTCSSAANTNGERLEKETDKER